MIKKLMTLFFGAALIALPATALMSSSAHASCYDPEFDAVGNDSANIFVDNVLAQIVNNEGSLEQDSDFTTYSSGVLYNPTISVQGQKYPDAVKPGVAGLLPFGNLAPAGGTGVGGSYACVAGSTAVPCQPAEFFTVGGTNFQAVADPCFMFSSNALGDTSHFPYTSVYTPERDGAIYRWRIVLQKKPASDIDINIEDCVLTETVNCATGIFTTPGETGFFNVGPYLLFWQQTLPTITAVAIPGPNASLGFCKIQQLYARTQPENTSCLFPICDLPFVSKALFDEAIVVAMPQTTNSLFPVGNFAPGYTLTGGDMIDISIGIPETTNPNDYYFGADNVFLKYIGMTGTGVYSSAN